MNGWLRDVGIAHRPLEEAIEGHEARNILLGYEMINIGEWISATSNVPA